MSNHMFFIRVNYVAKHELWILLWQMKIKIFMDMHQGNDLNWPLKIKNTNFTDFQSRKTLIYFYINIINRNGKQYIIVAKLRETFKLCFFMLKRDAVIKILDVVHMVNFRDGRFLILTKIPAKKATPVEASIWVQWNVQKLQFFVKRILTRMFWYIFFKISYKNHSESSWSRAEPLSL